MTIDVDARIRLVVRMLLARDGLTVDELADAVGMQRSTLFRRLRGVTEKGFTANEVARLAAYFAVPAGEFYDPSGVLFGGLRKARFSIPMPRTAA